MQTCTYSHPTPRLLLCPLRSPVMLPSFIEVDVDQLTGLLTLIAPQRLDRLQKGSFVIDLTSIWRKF
jgi:hypothetical protein